MQEAWSVEQAVRRVEHAVCSVKHGVFIMENAVCRAV